MNKKPMTEHTLRRMIRNIISESRNSASGNVDQTSQQIQNAVEARKLRAAKRWASVEKQLIKDRETEAKKEIARRIEADRIAELNRQQRYDPSGSYYSPELEEFVRSADGDWNGDLSRERADKRWRRDQRDSRRGPDYWH